MRIFIVHILILFSTSYGNTQNLDHFPIDNPLKTKIDSIVHRQVLEIMYDNSTLGLSFGISIDNKSFFYNYGSIEKWKHHLPDQNTIYEIGSITKTFTGILLANAILENRINLNDDIRKYLEDNYENLQYKDAPIRVQNLVNHTSGLPEDIIPEKIYNLNKPTMFDIVKVFEGDSGALFKNDLHKAKLDTFPGTRFQYSNAGMITLGIILENVYKKSYANLIEEYITGPFGMENTEIVFYRSDTIAYTKGYDNNGNIMPHITFQIAGAAGGLKSTTYDLLKFIDQNISEKDRAVNLSHQETFRDDQQAMGLGWQIKTGTKNNNELWHDGGEPGFSSYILIVPERKIGIICLANQRGLQYQFSMLCDAIIDGIEEY